MHATPVGMTKGSGLAEGFSSGDFARRIPPSGFDPLMLVLGSRGTWSPPCVVTESTQCDGSGTDTSARTFVRVILKQCQRRKLTSFPPQKATLKLGLLLIEDASTKEQGD